MANKTIFIDLDGTLIEHQSSPWNPDNDKILPGTIEKLKEWTNKGYKIILTTGRPLQFCVKVLNIFYSEGITFFQIVGNLPLGERILINDIKFDKDKKASSIEVKRNEGIQNIEL